MGKVTPGIPYLTGLHPTKSGAVISDRSDHYVDFTVYDTDSSHGGYVYYEGTLTVEQMFALLRPALVEHAYASHPWSLGDIPVAGQIVKEEVPNG